MTEDLYEQIWTEDAWQFYNLFKYPSLQENAQVGIGFLLLDIWQVCLRQIFLLLSQHQYSYHFVAVKSYKLSLSSAYECNSEWRAWSCKVPPHIWPWYDLWVCSFVEDLGFLVRSLLDDILFSFSDSPSCGSSNRPRRLASLRFHDADRTVQDHCLKQWLLCASCVQWKGIQPSLLQWVRLVWLQDLLYIPEHHHAIWPC